MKIQLIHVLYASLGIEIFLYFLHFCIDCHFFDVLNKDVNVLIKKGFETSYKDNEGAAGALIAFDLIMIFHISAEIFFVFKNKNYFKINLIVKIVLCIIWLIIGCIFAGANSAEVAIFLESMDKTCDSDISAMQDMCWFAIAYANLLGMTIAMLVLEWFCFGGTYYLLWKFYAGEPKINYSAQ